MPGHRHIIPASGGATGLVSEPATTPAFSIGKIEVVTGSCTLTRSGDSPVQIKHGDTVCQGDIIETSSGGKVCIRFIDGTVFDLSDSARMVLKEFAGDAASPSALFDISNGTFTFIAGEMAKAGQVDIDTPFGRIRGRPRSGGIGMLSLASLFFAAVEQVHAAPSDTSFLDDGNIRFKDLTSDYGVIELTTADGRTIVLDDPGETVVLRKVGSSVTESHVTNSVATMLSYQTDQADALRIFAMGPSGPAGNGSNGSSTPPPALLPLVPINFTPPTSGDPPHFSLGGPNGFNNSQDIFVPFIKQQQQPPPPIVITDSSSVNLIYSNAGITFRFDVAPTDFTLADTSATGGTLSNLVMVDATHFTATFTAFDGIQISNASVSVIAGSFHDINGNVGLGASTIFAVDTLAPRVAISTNDSVLKIGDVAHLTFTLSEAATNFTVSDITVTGGVLSNFAGSGSQYTADFTPNIQSTTTATVNVAGATFTDAAGNDNTAALKLTLTVDTVSVATWSISGDHRRHRGRHGALHGAAGRHAAGGRDGDGPSGARRHQHHQR